MAIKTREMMVKISKLVFIVSRDCKVSAMSVHKVTSKVQVEERHSQ